MGMTKALARQDHAVVRFSELVRLRNADYELTLLRQAMDKVLTQGQRDDLGIAVQGLEDDLPF